MKCSVCAQEVPEGRYGDHLAAEHGVTDDPSAVLFDHLTGDHGEAPPEGDEAAGDDVEEQEEFDGDDGDDTVTFALEDDEFDEETFDEEPESPPDEAAAAAPVAGDPTEELDAAGAGVDSEDVERADEAAARDPFAALTDAYPRWDVRGGAPDVGTVVLPPGEGKRRFFRRAAASPASPDQQRQRRRGWAMLGLAAAVVLIAAALIGVLTRDSGTSKTETVATTRARTRSTTRSTTATTEAPTFLAGPQGGATTTLGSVAPAVPAVPATGTTTTAAPNADPAAQMAFTYIDASCVQGQLTVRGNVANNSPATYSFAFTVEIVNPAGAVLGTANGSVEHLASHNTVGFVATGTCTDVTGGRPRQRITSITPG